MQKAHRAVVLLALAAALLGNGCRQPVPDDASVTAAVQTRIAGDSAIASESIQSSVQAGVATLNGAVSSDAARALAANDAAQVPGVRTVVNNLTVGNIAVANPQQTLQTSPAATVNTPPTRIRTIPSKPVAIDRQKIHANTLPPPPAPISQNIPPTADQAATVERSTEQAPPPPAPTFRNIDVPIGTSIPVRITQTLDSASTQQGDTFSGVVASDVLVDGLVVIPQGSPVRGHVDVVQEAAHFKGNSLLTISLTNISRRGERIPISTEAYSKQGSGRGKNTAEKTGVGAAAGAILGGIFGGGKGAAIGAAAGGGTGAGINAVTRGEQVQIPSETLVPFRLATSINVRVPTRNQTRPDEIRSPDRSPDRSSDQGNQSDPQRRPLQQQP